MVSGEGCQSDLTKEGVWSYNLLLKKRVPEKAVLINYEA